MPSDLVGAGSRLSLSCYPGPESDPPQHLDSDPHDVTVTYLNVVAHWSPAHDQSCREFRPEHLSPTVVYGGTYPSVLHPVTECEYQQMGRNFRRLLVDLGWD